MTKVGSPNRLDVHRYRRLNTLTGEGLAGVLEGAWVVVKVSNAPSYEDAAVLEFSYFGAELHERTLVPADDAQLPQTRFDHWLSQPTIGN